MQKKIYYDLPDLQLVAELMLAVWSGKECVCVGGGGTRKKRPFLNSSPPMAAPCSLASLRKSQHVKVLFFIPGFFFLKFCVPPSPSHIRLRKGLKVHLLLLPGPPGLGYLSDITQTGFFLSTCGRSRQVIECSVLLVLVALLL